MKFGEKKVPDSMFDVAREKMLSEKIFTPNSIRLHLLEVCKDEMEKITSIPGNKWIVANRVMRAVVEELVDTKKLRSVKRGLWAKIE